MTNPEDCIFNDLALMSFELYLVTAAELDIIHYCQRSGIDVDEDDYCDHFYFVVAPDEEVFADRERNHPGRAAFWSKVVSNG